MPLTDVYWTCPHCHNVNATPLRDIHKASQLCECDRCHTVFLGALSWLMETYYQDGALE